jgi:hypothetical protein
MTKGDVDLIEDDHREVWQLQKVATKKSLTNRLWYRNHCYSLLLALKLPVASFTL